MLDHIRAAGAQADYHPPAAELIQGREMLRQRRGSARVGVHDRRPELDLPGMLGEYRKRRERVASPRLPAPNRMEPGLLGEFGALDERLEVELAQPIRPDCQLACHCISPLRPPECCPPR